MIPYFKAERKESKIECSCEFVVMDDNKLVTMSITDIPQKVKKVIADVIATDGRVTLCDREDIFYEQGLSCWNEHFRYKLTKHSDTRTHAIIHNTKIDEYCFDWNGEGVIKVITRYLRNKKFLPVTESIVEQVIELKGIENVVSECNVYTTNEELAHVKVYKLISLYYITEYLSKSNLNIDDTYDWENVNDIGDYLVRFAEPIKEKLSKNINILFDENKVNPHIHDNLKLFDGQVPIVQGGVEILKKKSNGFLYLASAMGTGKSTMSTKINHLYHIEKEKDSYCTLIVVPAITVKQWQGEIERAIGKKNVDVHIIKKTDDFIRLYNDTNFKFAKPTYLIVGKETFKLSYQKVSGVNVRKRKMKRKVKNERYGWEEYKIEELEVCLCPDCGKPIQNTLRKTEDIYFNKQDFSKPKKSNYKCNHCDSVLFQAVYSKTKKTSVIDFVKRKNIKFDTIIIDEAHEGNNYDSLIGSATRDLMRKAKKVILLSGTVSNGYASSIFNILYALIPNTLIDDNVFEKEKFVKTYGTLMSVNKKKDSEYFASGRVKEKDSDFQEIEGINPLVFTKYFANNFIFAELEDIRDDLPKLIEKYIPVKHLDNVKYGENRLINDIKSANAFNASFYNDSVVKHYVNNPFKWSSISISNNEITKVVQPKNINNVILPKEKELIKICKDELSNNRKVWVYCDFVNGGQYTEGESVQDRLKRVLKANGLKVFTLKASVSTIERGEVIAKNKDKYDVFISHPKLISVGVNLQWCTNYVFYSPTYQVNIVRQAMRRGLRANSTEDNHIYHLYYEDTIEHGIMERYKLKRVESESIEAKFLDDEAYTIRTASSLSNKIVDKI